MKENSMSESVGATAFDLPNSQNPQPHFKAMYGNQHVPHPTNEKAKKVDHSKVMRQVREAK